MEHRRRRAREGVRGWTERTRRVYRRTTWAGRPYGPPGRHPHRRVDINLRGRLWTPEEQSPGAPRQSALQRLGPVVSGDRPSVPSRSVEPVEVVASVRDLARPSTSESNGLVKNTSVIKPTHQGAANSPPSAAMSGVSPPSAISSGPTRKMVTQTPTVTSAEERRHLKNVKRRNQRKAKLTKILELPEEKIVKEGLKKLALHSEPTWQVAKWIREGIDIPGVLLSSRPTKAEEGSESTPSSATISTSLRPQDNPAPMVVDPPSVLSPPARPITPPWQDEAKALPPTTSVSTTSADPKSRPAPIPSTSSRAAKTSEPAAAKGQAGRRILTRSVAQAGGSAAQASGPEKKKKKKKKKSKNGPDMLHMDWVYGPEFPDDWERQSLDSGWEDEIPRLDDRNDGEEVLELKVNSDDELGINDPDKNMDL